MMRPVQMSDWPELGRWYRARGQGLRPETLPKCGVMVPNLAAGFLYRTDSTVCLLDGYVTNPDAPSLPRARALREITTSLLTSAKLVGATYVMALCKSRGIERLAKRFGLAPVGTYLLAGRGL